MYHRAFGFEQVVVALKFGVFLLLFLYGTRWLLSGDPGFSGAELHPMLLVAAVVSAYCGVVGGAAVFALALLPYAAYDLPVRGIEQSFQSHKLEVLFWPALAAVAVVVLGGLRDLREHKLSAAHHTIAGLHRDLEAVQSASEAALSALRRNEAAIAMRNEISPLPVFKALLQMRDGDGANFEKDLSRFLWVVSSDAEFALFTRQGTAVSASPGISSNTLALMRRLAKDAEGAGLKLDPSEGYVAEGQMIIACSVSDESGLVICVSCKKETASEYLADYLAEIAGVIEVQARKFARPHAQKAKKGAAA